MRPKKQIVASHTIRVSEEIYQYLLKQGTKADTFDSLIRKLLPEFTNATRSNKDR